MTGLKHFNYSSVGHMIEGESLNISLMDVDGVKCEHEILPQVKNIEKIRSLSNELHLQQANED